MPAMIYLGEIIMEFDGPGSTIKHNADGTVSISTTAGDVIEIDQKGSASVHLKQIKSVGIHNLADVESHNINNIVGSISHYVRFIGGGEVRFVYNASGQLIELSATNVITTVSQNNEIVFKRKQAT